MAHEGDDSQAKRKRGPRLASDLLEPGMVIAHPAGLEDALAKELGLDDDSFSGTQPLDASAFDRSPAPNPARNPAPRPDSTELYEPPTVRLDLEGPSLPDLATQEIPLPSPRRLVVREPTVVHPDAWPPPAPTIGAPRGVPLSLPQPSTPPPPLPGLPLGAGPGSQVAAPAATPKVNLPCNLLIVDPDLRTGSQTAAKLMELGYTCRVVGDGLIEAALSQQRYDAAVVEVPPEEAAKDRGLGRLARLSTFSGPIVLTSPAVLPPEGYGPPHRVRGSLQRPFFAESLAGTIEAARQGLASSPPAPAAAAPSARGPAPAAFPSSPPLPPPKPARVQSPVPQPSDRGRITRPPTASSEGKAAQDRGPAGPPPAPPLASATVSTARSQEALTLRAEGRGASPGPTTRSGRAAILPLPSSAPTAPPAAPPTSTLPAASSAALGDGPTGPIFPEGVAEEALIELDVNVVRAVLVDGDRPNTRGRVRALSRGGRVLVEAREPFEEGTAVMVELTTVEGLRGELAGRVAGSTDTEMGIELVLPAVQQGLFRRFLDEARDVTQPLIEQVRIRAVPAAVPLEEKVADTVGLEQRWLEVKDHLADDPRQQHFIQECLKAQRLEFAVQCYRGLKTERPDDPLAAKYLNQVGTILGFYALRKEKAPVDKGMPNSVKFTLLAFIIAALMIWVIVEVLRG